VGSNRDRSLKELLDRVREAYREPYPFRFSDDMDDWLVAQGMPSYTEQAADRLKDDEIARTARHEELWEVGARALPEVRKALKGVGRWRTILVTFLAEFGGTEEDREVLRLIALRWNDPLDGEVRALLREWGESTEHLVPRPRTGPTPSQIAKEERLARLVDLCCEPFPVRGMMKALGLWDRRNFNRNYLTWLCHRRYIRSCGTKGPHRDCYVVTAEGLEWLRMRENP
jgi:hypothetical protein